MWSNIEKMKRSRKNVFVKKKGFFGKLAFWRCCDVTNKHLLSFRFAFSSLHYSFTIPINHSLANLPPVPFLCRSSFCWTLVPFGCRSSELIEWLGDCAVVLWHLVEDWILCANDVNNFETYFHMNIIFKKGQQIWHFSF